MKKNTFQQLQILLITLIFSYTINAQVGIGTTTPNANALLEIDASTNVGGLLLPRVGLTSTTSFAPLAAHVQGMTVYNTATNLDVTPGQYYNDGTRWIRVERTAPISSVTLTTDEVLTKNTPGGQAPAFAAVPGMTLTFIAHKPTVMINLTASGLGLTNSMSIISFRVMNGGVSIGGTMTKIQNYDDITGTITTWSLAFSKPLTGLTIGNTYTLTVEGQAGPSIIGGEDAAIFAATNPDQSHLTLTVMQ